MTLNKKLDILNYMNKLHFNDYLWFIHGLDYRRELDIWKKVFTKYEIQEDLAEDRDMVSLKSLDNYYILKGGLGGDFFYLCDDGTYEPANKKEERILRDIGNEVRSKITEEELKEWSLGVKI